MFKEARIKLTVFYLIIIMVITGFFSVVIYRGATAELNRIQNIQRLRRPVGVVIQPIDVDLIDETKTRIAVSLLILNGIILGISGIAGYFLAGKTLDPIAKMMDEQKEFVSNASHELRTPLTSLKTEIEVAIRDKKITLTEAKKLLQSNLDDVNRMTSLSNYLLELNKFQSGRDGIKFSKVDLAGIAKEAAGKKNVKLYLQKVTVNGNRDSLVELVMILIDNAFKYSPKNGEVSVRVRDSEIQVEDHGIGISETDLPHIFDRFYRSDKARANDGYGLGLSIAYQIAQMHGAKISVESKIGKGTTFKVVFS